MGSRKILMTEAAKDQKPTADSPNPDGINARINQYNKVVRLAKLSSLLLEKIDFKILPEALTAKSSELKRDLNVKTKVMGYDSESGDCVASIVWSVEIKKKRKRVVKCGAGYIVVYQEIKDCPEDMVQMFIDHVGKTATYAYFRALYAHLDWSANLRSPPLPVLHIQPSVRKIRQNYKEAASQSEAP